MISIALAMGTSKPINIPLRARQEGVILLGRARFFECSQQCFLLPGSWIEDAVDKERRRSTHTAAYAALKILLDTANVRTFCHVTCELLHIQANRLGKLLQVGILKRMLVVEDGIMHLPELALSCGGLGSQSRVQRVGMDFGKREVAKDKAQLVPKLLLNRSHDGRRLAGVGAFVVAILHESDRSGGRSLMVVPLTDGNRKMFSLCHHPLSFSTFLLNP